MNELYGVSRQMPTAVQDVHRTSDAPGSAPPLPCETVPDRGNGPKLLNHAPPKSGGDGPGLRAQHGRTRSSLQQNRPTFAPTPDPRKFPETLFFFLIIGSTPDFADLHPYIRQLSRSHTPSTPTTPTTWTTRRKDRRAATPDTMADSLLARKYFDGIYIPLGLLVFGTAIVKREWTAYALLLGITLGSIKYYNSRTFPFATRLFRGTNPSPLTPAR